MIPRLGAWIARELYACQYLVDTIRNFPAQKPFAAMLGEAGFCEIGYRNLSLGIACLHAASYPPGDQSELSTGGNGQPPNSRD